MCLEDAFFAELIVSASVKSRQMYAKRLNRAIMYRIVLKYWDTQRIGPSLKIVKIIILADPKYWTILRKRKNIRNFSDPKNWDGIFGAPK